MVSPDYAEVVNRIQDVYNSCSVIEQKQLLKILQEVAAKGYSETLETMWLVDFKEVPVSIDRFICDPYYLGSTNNNGDMVYPYWRETMRNIFNSGNRYNEIILSGATRLGKSSTCTTMMAYMLYRLMLYRDPHSYFKKKQVSRFTLGFANLTKELAMSVCYREFNDTMKAVPWFCEHGKFTRSDRNFYYVPEGDKIEIIPASSGEQLLGKQIWCCLVGDTKIITSSGIVSIDEFQDGQVVQVLQYNSSENSYKFVEAQVVLTKYVKETVQVELEDGSIIEGTPDHKVMLSDGTYKPLGDLSEDDDIMEV